MYSCVFEKCVINLDGYILFFSRKMKFLKIKKIKFSHPNLYRCFFLLKKFSKKNMTLF
jgi:hypothetical protein